ncbi:hypothetical protein SAMN00790413_04505 [Deinococcus hopiensis KR-140]|uniref:Uncharacterized protein n=1 Tax=Deinococcus hopiensis KR-140 TaxID=695939 RepID=A0A1W1UJE9_9DEIO|nr:hypothetical protein SAMN00790413_04505 [Deinococcus hopiensis KR-140]
MAEAVQAGQEKVGAEDGRDLKAQYRLAEEKLFLREALPSVSLLYKGRFLGMTRLHRHTRY